MKTDLEPHLSARQNLEGYEGPQGLGKGAQKLCRVFLNTKLTCLRDMGSCLENQEVLCRDLNDVYETWIWIYYAVPKGVCLRHWWEDAVAALGWDEKHTSTLANLERGALAPHSAQHSPACSPVLNSMSAQGAEVASYTFVLFSLQLASGFGKQWSCALVQILMMHYTKLSNPLDLAFSSHLPGVTLFVRVKLMQKEWLCIYHILYFLRAVEKQNGFTF